MEHEPGRQDRTIGQAAAQLEVVHRCGAYEPELDTSLLAPAVAAARIAAASES